MSKNATTALAGQALANAVNTANRTGIGSRDTIAAAEIAAILTDSALKQGATATDIRRAGGLPTEGPR